MSDQYDMKRQQRFSFTEEEAERINLALDIMKGCTNKDVTPNKFFRTSAVARANRVNKEGSKR